jgi:hypothetical protein
MSSLLTHPAPLYYAALCGFRDVAEHLIDVHRQNVNARGGLHLTPLHAALDMGHPSVAMLSWRRWERAGVEYPWLSTSQV